MKGEDSGDNNMIAEHFSVGSRIDLGGYKGTVKYLGEIPNTEGFWLGIDWDDPQRGKHDGTNNGIRYFQASHPTSGSFIRPGKATKCISIIEAIEKRYGLVSAPNAGLDIGIMMELQLEIGANLFEVVGAEKLNKLQSDFQNLRVVLLRDFPINSVGPPSALLRLCPNIEELDLSKTLFVRWDEIAEIGQQLKRLRILNLSENRLEISQKVQSESFENVEHVVLGKLSYNWSQVRKCAEYFLNVQFFQVQYNRIELLERPSEKIFSKLKLLDLEGNPIYSWDEINKLGSLENLETLYMTKCGIQEVHFPGTGTTYLFKNLKSLVLTENKINDWESISELDKLENFRDFRFRENPILNKETPATNRQLIIARIRRIQCINGQVVLRDERKGAEVDYLRRYGAEWMQIKSEEDSHRFNKLHPGYQRLVNKYGPPEKDELKQIDTSLKSKLIQIEIFSMEKTITKKVPKDMSISKLSGLVQRLFNMGSIPILFCIHAKRKEHLEVPLDNNFKGLNFYDVESGDKIVVRW